MRGPPSSAPALDYIMEIFSLVKNEDEAAYSRYRTREAILCEYDDVIEIIFSKSRI